MPLRPASTTLWLGASALALVLVLWVLGGRSLGFGHALAPWGLAGSPTSELASPTALRTLQLVGAALVAVVALGLLHDLTRSRLAALAGALVLATAPTQIALATEYPAVGCLGFGAAAIAMFASWARFRLAGRTSWWGLALVAYGLAAHLSGGGLVLLPLLLAFDLVLFTGASRSLRVDVGELFRQRSRHLPFVAVGVVSHLFVAPSALVATKLAAAWLPAALGGGLAACAALVGRSASESFREVRLALFGALVLGAACTQGGGTAAAPLAILATALLWGSAGLALARAGSARLARVTTFTSTLGALLVLQVGVALGEMDERARQDSLAKEVLAATREVLPLLVEPVARGQRIRTEFAPVDEDTLRAIVVALARVPDPGVKIRDPGSTLVLRWQGAQGWRLY